MQNKKYQPAILFLSFTFLIASLISSFFAFNISIVYAADTINATLQNITTPYTNDTTNLNNFYIKNEQEFYFTDTINNKVVVWKEDSVEEFGSAGPNPENFAGPSLISVLANGDIYVYDTGRRLKVFSSNYVFQNNYNMVYSNGGYIFMGRLSSISSDLKNNLYALDFENNIIIKKSSNSNELVKLIDATSLGFTLNINSQIALSPNGETIFLSNIYGGNNIYYIDNLLSLNQVDIATHSITTVSQIAIDCANNLFILEKDAVDTKLHKLTKSTYIYESYLTSTANEFYDINKFNINIETGQIVLINSTTNTLQTIDLSSYAGTFTENISSFVNPINYVEAVYLSTSAKIANVILNNAPLLQTPYNITPILSLIEDDKLIILSQTVDSNPDYYYALYINSQTENNIAGYILKQNVEVLLQDPQTPYYVSALNNGTNLYKYPTSLNSNLSLPIILDQVNKNDGLKILSNAFNIMDANGEEFFEVELAVNRIAYVRAKDVVLIDLDIIVPTLYTNAEIKITDDSGFVNVYLDYNNSQTLLSHTLKAGDRVYVTTFNLDEPWTQVTFLNNNNYELTGYVLTKYVNVYGEYNNLLRALLLSLVSFTLIVILLIIKSKKKTED